MDLHDYIQDNAAFWQDVEEKGFIQAMNEWFIKDDRFAELAVEHIEKLSGEPKDNWNDYPKAYVEQYLYDPDSVNEEPPEVKHIDNDFNPDEIDLPF